MVSVQALVIAKIIRPAKTHTLGHCLESGVTSRGIFLPLPRLICYIHLIASNLQSLSKYGVMGWHGVRVAGIRWIKPSIEPSTNASFSKSRDISL
jgi:hypothetical protein